MCAIYLIGQSTSAAVSEASSIFFLEKTGNNQHEAKIAALHDVMRRALMIFAEKSGISLKAMNETEPSYQELKSCTVVEKVFEEKSKQNFYQANAKITCLPYAALEVLSKFAQDPKQIASLKSSIKPPKSQALTAVMPILKKNRISLTHGTDWHKAWRRNSDLLAQSDMMLLESLKAQNSIEYKGLQESFPNCPNLIVIACAELFTNYEGLFSCKVEYRLLSDNGSEILERKTPYESGADLVMNESVKSFCLNDVPELKAKIKAKPSKTREILLEVYRRDVQNLASAISNIGSLGKIKFKAQRPGLYLLRLNTTLDDYLVAEQLYIKGLGYVKNKDRYRVLQLCY